MAVERTFSIIKPDATRRSLTGKINARFEENGRRERYYDDGEDALLMELRYDRG